jgi:protein arginine N-methyltransferase 1
MSEIELHRKLLGDRVRNQAFAAALKKVIEPGKSTVADIGAGTGFLSFLARQLGAANCTLIEYADTLELAQQLARDNGITGLTFIKGHSAELAKPAKVDLVISETLGNYALEEGLLETLVDARRFLKKGGRLIPGRLRQFVAPVLTPRLQEEIDIWPRVGFELDLTAAREVCLNNMFVRLVQPADLGGSVRHAQLWDDLDFSPDATAPASLRRKSLHWTAAALAGASVYGFSLWWEAELIPGISISTAPDAPATHWEQIYLPLLSPVTLAGKDTLELTLSSDTRPQVGVRLTWRTRQLRAGKAVLEQAQDIARGRI